MNFNANEILLGLIPEAEKERVFSSDAIADISPEFLCFADTYYHLSQIIPKDWTVIDFGCAYNAQSYFFTEHKRFMTVNPQEEDLPNGWHLEHFCAPNCEYYKMTTGEFLRTVDYPKKKVFAICNMVPPRYHEDSMKLVREHFKNNFTFYIE